MAERSDQQLLRQVVISNSEADNGIEAKTEWRLITIFDNPNNCICNHAILENCVIKNRNNGTAHRRQRLCESF